MFKMFNWLKNVFSIFKKLNNKQLVGDVGLINAKAEINTDIKAEAKIADTQNNKLVEINNNDNSQHIHYHYQGMSISDIKQLVKDEQNAADKRLIILLSKSLLEEDRNKIINDYDLLYTYNEAVKISARKKDDDIDMLLSKALKDRITTKEDFIKMACNETINTIGRLTKKHLEILRILTLMHHTCLIKNLNIKEYSEHLNDVFLKNLDIEIHVADIEYLVFSGCIIDVSPNHYVFEKVMHKYNNTSIDDEKLNNNPNYIKLKNIFERRMLQYSKLTVVGKYIGFKYNEIKNGQSFDNIDEIFKI